MWKKKYIQQFISFDVRKLPKGCNVATMTIFLKLKDNNMQIDLKSFYESVDVTKDDIHYIEYENEFKCYQFEKKRTKKKISNFQNSLSLYIKIRNNYIHFNFFKNGTIHGTGIKDVKDFIDAVYLIKKKISSDMQIQLISISMININFILPYELNKNILKKVLREQNVHYNINKTQNISIYFYTSKSKEILITIHKNSLIISKCTCEIDIIESYNWINQLLKNNKNQLIDISIEEVLANNSILKSNYNGK